MSHGSMALHRFFYTAQPLEPHQVVDLTNLAHQLHVVLRLRAGDPIVLLDNEGEEAIAELQYVDSRRAQALVLARRPALAEPRVSLTLYQGSLKADKFEWVLQKGTELGVTRFVPVITSHSVMRPAVALLDKYTRWRTIMREAAEQCGRGRLPELAEPLTGVASVVATTDARFLPCEPRLVDASPPLGEAVAAAGPVTSVSLLIGPEGGFTDLEVEHAQAAGWQVVTLGPRVLRAETAALAAITIVLDRLGELRFGQDSQD